MDLAEIRAVETWLARLDPGRHPPHELRELALALEGLRNRVEAVDVAVLAELEQRGACADDGALSAATWVAAQTGSPVGDLRRRQRTGRGLRLLPGAVAAARSGRLSPEHLRRLADCVDRQPERAAREADGLLGLAHTLPAAGFAVAASQWCSAADAVTLGGRASPPPPDEPPPLNQVRHWRTLDRVLCLTAELRGDDADLVEAALEGRFDQLLRAVHDGDVTLAGFGNAELRAQALVDLLAQTQRREPSDRSQPDRYRVAVIVHASDDPDALASPATAMALCDAPAFRAVINAKGEALDIGRQSKHWSVAIRRAITLRDQGCVFPGCDRPASWCDAHHCQPWGEDGETKVDNGALLCRRHHTFIHAEGWRVAISKPRGRPQVHRPDGSVYRIDRWPQPETSTA
jgi:hypothetical protein